MHSSRNLNRWRKIGLVAASVAVIAVGGTAIATQAFADTDSTAASSGPSAARSGTGTSSAAKSGNETSRAGKQAEASSEWTPAPDCSDLRADLTFTSVPQAGEALKAALGSVAQGTISDVSGYRGSATCHHPEHVGASLSFAPDAGSSEVQVSTTFLAPGEFDYAGGAEAYVSTCELGDLARSEDCQVSTLPDGTTLRTHSFTQRSGGVDTTWQIAERLVDGYIVNVNAIGEDALSRDEVAAIASELTPIR